jgi:hypothetical protein
MSKTKTPRMTKQKRFMLSAIEKLRPHFGQEGVIGDETDVNDLGALLAALARESGLPLSEASEALGSALWYMSCPELMRGAAEDLHPQCAGGAVFEAMFNAGWDAKSDAIDDGD